MAGEGQRRMKVLRSCVALVVLVRSATAYACPVCDTETGRAIRDGIFDQDFFSNVCMTLAPFPIMLVLVGVMHISLPLVMLDTKTKSSR